MHKIEEIFPTKAFIAVVSAVPFAMLLFDALTARLGPNPIEFFLRATGVLTMIFLTLTLAVTPMRRLTGWNSLIKSRRLLGLFAFFYASMHLITYSIFDKSGNLRSIIDDVAQRPFIAFGMAGYLMLVPLAITSTKAWVRRLGGKNWKLLHKLTYLIAIIGVIHFWMIVKSDIFYPASFAVLIGALLLFRIGYYLLDDKKKGGRAK